MGTWQTAAARRQHDLDEFAPLPACLTAAVPNRRNRDLELRQAVLLAFCDPLSDRCSRLLELSPKQWQKMLPWLDTSGLALYLFDRLAGLQLLDVLPEQVRSRLAENLADNTVRMRSLAAETIEIHREFHHAGVSHAVLKGISFWPHSVPKLELRSQLDLDFLVAESAAGEARQILERRGYHLHAISGRTWEFKTGPLPPASLDSLYKAVPHRSVELHLESEARGNSPLLARTQTRSFLGADLPVLAPPDLLLGQGLHLFKHYMSEFSRAAHLLEFRRHILAHRNDPALWSELRSRAQRQSRARRKRLVWSRCSSRLSWAPSLQIHSRPGPSPLCPRAQGSGWKCMEPAPRSPASPATSSISFCKLNSKQRACTRAAPFAAHCCRCGCRLPSLTRRSAKHSPRDCSVKASSFVSSCFVFGFMRWRGSSTFWSGFGGARPAKTMQ